MAYDIGVGMGWSELGPHQYLERRESALSNLELDHISNKSFFLNVP